MKPFWRKNTNKIKLHYIFGVCCASILLSFFCLPYAFIGDNASALRHESCGTDGIRLAASTAKINITALDATGGFGYGLMLVTVCTDNASGYTLTLGAGESGNELKYDHKNQNSATIESITTPEGEEVYLNGNKVAGMPVNKWGWSYSNADPVLKLDPLYQDKGIDASTGLGFYYPIPAYGSSTLVASSHHGGEQVNSIYFGARINTERPYGDYSGTVVLTATPNTVATITVNDAYSLYGKSKPSESEYYAMQDMNGDICAAIANNETGTLIDTRNNMTYTITKAKDGNCWMSSDLDASQDSCADGWTLPTARDYGELMVSSVTGLKYAGTGTSYANVTNTAFPGAGKYQFPTNTTLLGMVGQYLVNDPATSTTTFNQTRFSAMNASAPNAEIGTLTGTGEHKIRCFADSATPSEPIVYPTDTPVAPVDDGGTPQLFSMSLNSPSEAPKEEGLEQDADALGVLEETSIPDDVLAAVARVEALIRGLPSASDVTLEYASLIEEAISAYESLSDFERSLIDSYLGLKYGAVVAAYHALLDNQPINLVVVGLCITGAAIATGAVVAVAAKKRREDRYYGED